MPDLEPECWCDADPCECPGQPGDDSEPIRPTEDVPTPEGLL